MPAPLPIKIRREIVERHETGETLRSISEEMKLPYDTVRKIWQHWSKHGKLEPNYTLAKVKGTRKYKAVYELAIQLKGEHPKWGATLILLKLGETLPAAELPSERTLQRWFRQAGISRTPKVQRGGAKTVKRGKAVHEVWAVDAKERLRLADGSWASWLVVTDEASGAILYAEAFSPEELDTSRG